MCSALFAGGMPPHLGSARLADEIDAIAPKRESVQREMERRIVAQMLTCMDDLAAPLPGAPAAVAGGAREGAEPEAPELERAAAAAHRHVVVIGARAPCERPPLRARQHCRRRGLPGSCLGGCRLPSWTVGSRAQVWPCVSPESLTCP